MRVPPATELGEKDRDRDLEKVQTNLSPICLGANSTARTLAPLARLSLRIALSCHFDPVFASPPLAVLAPPSSQIFTVLSNEQLTSIVPYSG
jgi:hypothetical protein